MSIETFSRWLELTPASQWIQATSWVVPATQSVHIIALAVIVTANAMAGARLLGVVASKLPLRQELTRLLGPVFLLFPVSLLTGLVLIVGEPPRELLSPYFWAKMLILLVALLITWVVAARMPDAPLGELPAGQRRLARLLGLIVLLAWALVVFCGRWIAYG